MSHSQPTRLFALDDIIRHDSMPEWGRGTVVKAERIVVQGKPCQRLQVRFERAGLKTVATGIAPIVLADDPSLDTRPRDSSGDGSEVALPLWLEHATEDQVRVRFARLPESVTDDSASVMTRFEACLRLYRWKPEGRHLVDWAAVQTGLQEPLAVFNRAQLEVYFEKYRINRDSAVRRIVDLGKRQCHAEMVHSLAASSPDVQAAVEQALRLTSL